jgi:hypothetical protein
MPRKKPEDLQKHTLNLRAGDFERLGEIFPDLGPSVALRSIISAVIDKHHASIAPKINLDQFNL